MEEDISDSIIADIVRSRDTKRAAREANAKASPFKSDAVRSASIQGTPYKVCVGKDGLSLSRGGKTKLVSWGSMVDATAHSDFIPGGNHGGYDAIHDAKEAERNGVSGAMYKPVHGIATTGPTSINKNDTQWRVVVDRWGVWMRPIDSNELSTESWRYADWVEIRATAR